MTTISRRSGELAAAAAIGIFGAIVVAGSWPLHVGWDATGPGAGYFPFRLGVILCAVALLLFVQAARAVPGAEPFVQGEQLRRSFSIFWPVLLLTIAMGWVGCYVALAVYLFYMAKAQGGYPAWKAAGIAAIAVVSVWLVFETCFKVPLAKGPIEAWLGLQ